MFEKIKNLFKKALDKNFESAQVSLNEPEQKSDYEASQIEIEPEPVIKKAKRSVKYRK